MKTINGLTEKDIDDMVNNKVGLYCENCNYETTYGILAKAVFEVNMHGGYYIFDGVGGCMSQCPICKKDSLVTINN